jgi:hypothetical protein
MTFSIFSVCACIVFHDSPERHKDSKLGDHTVIDPKTTDCEENTFFFDA